MKTIGVIAFGMCAALFAACGSAPTESTTEQPGATQSADSTDAGVLNAFLTCTTNADCVAVPLIQSCCDNGEKIAVATTEVQAYEATTACSEEQRLHALCPMIHEIDTRVAACNTTTCQCEMVPGPGAGGDDAGEDGGIIVSPLPNPIVF